MTDKPIELVNPNLERQSITHQTLIAEGVVHTAKKEPEGPQILKAKLEEKVCRQHQ